MALARELGCSIAIMREGDGVVNRCSAYRHSTLVPPSFAGHPRVIVVDDVISSGGTFIAMLAEIARLDCELAGGIVILAKGTEGIERVRQAAAVPVIPLATLSKDRRVHITMMADNPV
jgi:adenine/guanine phosphoribosyltransferase-like PRPP-binding protein